MDTAGDEYEDTDVEDHDDDDERAAGNEEKPALKVNGQRVEDVAATKTATTSPKAENQTPVRIPDRKTRWTCFQ